MSFQPGRGDPKPLVEFRTGAITDRGFTPDSKEIALVYGASGKDVVPISGFR